jgi:hypothetical protein
MAVVHCHNSLEQGGLKGNGVAIDSQCLPRTEVFHIEYLRWLGHNSRHTQGTLGNDNVIQGGCAARCALQAAEWCYEGATSRLPCYLAVSQHSSGLGNIFGSLLAAPYSRTLSCNNTNTDPHTIHQPSCASTKPQHPTRPQLQNPSGTSQTKPQYPTSPQLQEVPHR